MLRRSHMFLPPVKSPAFAAIEIRNGKKVISENNKQPMVIIRGRAVNAVYRKPECPDHEGNPLIEALPPILTDDQAMIRLAYYPKYDESQRNAPAHIRYL